MKKRIEIRVNKELLNELEKFKRKNNYDDLQDAILEILKNKFFRKSFFKILKDYFKI